jgi:hypothetical protein
MILAAFKFLLWDAQSETGLISGVLKVEVGAKTILMCIHVWNVANLNSCPNFIIILLQKF